MTTTATVHDPQRAALFQEIFGTTTWRWLDFDDDDHYDNDEDFYY